MSEPKKTQAELIAELQLEEQTDLDTVMRSEAGRRFVARLLFRMTGFQTVTLGTNAHEIAFNEGRRSIGVALDRELLLNHRSSWALMHRERVDRLATLELETKAPE